MAMDQALNEKIAFKICELENDPNISRKYAAKWEEFRYRIEGTNVMLTGSDDFMVWRIWKSVKAKTCRYYLKIIPRFGLSFEQIFAILEASDWLCA